MDGKRKQIFFFFKTEKQAFFKWLLYDILNIDSQLQHFSFIILQVICPPKVDYKIREKKRDIWTLDVPWSYSGAPERASRYLKHILSSVEPSGEKTWFFVGFFWFLFATFQWVIFLAISRTIQVNVQSTYNVGYIWLKLETNINNPYIFFKSFNRKLRIK